MSKIIGIDLGTTNSCVSVMEGGKPVVIANLEGSRTTPSIVAFSDKGETLVGQPAKNQMITNPGNTIRSVKRLMGRSFSELQGQLDNVTYEVKDSGDSGVVVVARGKEFSPQEISSKILQKLKQAVEDYLGQKIEEAVITVPAYFNDSQRQATKDAGRIAGLNVKRIVNEPTAAALAYGLNKSQKNEKLAVYDLGGGTFDITILELGDGVFEVKSTNGDTQLGGDDFDFAIINYLAQEFQNETGIDLKKDKIALQRLREESEKAKKELSVSKSVNINLPFITADANGPKHLNVVLTRAKFEQLVSSILEKAVQPCVDAIKDAGLEAKDIDKVVLVGGSTRIPLVQEHVKRIFGKDPGKGVNPDEVVAMGAAIQGGILGGDVRDVLLLDVLSLSLGIETLGGVMSKLIERNTTIPAKKSQVFSTAADNQTAVSIKVYQGEREMVVHNKLIGNFELVGISPQPRGVPQIEVAFDVDANGIINVSAKDLSSKKEQKIQINISGGLAEEEIQRMVKDAEVNAEEDKRLRNIAEVRNKSEHSMYQAIKMVDALKELSGDKKKAFEQSVAELKNVLNGEDVAKMEKLASEVMSMAQTLSQEFGAKDSSSSKVGGSSSATSSDSSQGGGEKEKKVEDADYEVMDDEKK